MKRLLFVLLFTGAIWNCYAQIHAPAKWRFNSVSVNDSDVDLLFTVTLDEGWHIYSQNLGADGPLPTTFLFDVSESFTRVDSVMEFGKPVQSYDKTFMMNITWFTETVVFRQRVKLHKPSTIINGKIQFMVCTDEMCLPPDEVSFSIEVTATKPMSRKIKKTSNAIEEPDKSRHDLLPTKDESKVDTIIPNGMDSTNHDLSTIQIKSTGNREADSLWEIFIAGIIGGLAALIMPCIFPMIPLTISFFNNRGGSRAVYYGLLYGVSIVVLYVTLGIGVSIAFGSTAMNELATNGIFNFCFFILLTIFAASLFGAFEIVLPSSWITKADQKADRSGILAIFFMAATLALVSFSCTAPIIGTLLVKSATVQNYRAPVMGMLGFSLALALPFSLFAMFPSLLKALPKSGGWLNSIKVALGFLELAFALKFLSNVDLAYHWNWFDREVFLVLWIIIFALLGFYLLGKLKLKHDSNLEHISTSRLFLSIVTLAFTLYMIPGLWGAPLKVISAFLPPTHTQDFDLYSHRPGVGVVNVSQSDKKYGDIFKSPLSLNAFFDFDEGMKYAEQVNKPVIIDFTGHACVNCRKMEAEVWSDPRVLYRLQNDYVLIQLYVDDKTELHRAEQYTSLTGRTIKTIGGKWSDLQASAFGTNAQPWYILMGHDNRTLTEPQGADYDAERFSQFLDEGLAEFNHQMKLR